MKNLRTHNNAHRNVDNESKFVTKNNNYYSQSLCQIPPGLWKYFIRPSINSSFHDRLESVQYNACLAITGAIRGTTKEKLHQELGLESLRLQRQYRKRCLFYKMFKNQHPEYLFHLIPVKSAPYIRKTKFFEKPFYPVYCL